VGNPGSYADVAIYNAALREYACAGAACIDPYNNPYPSHSFSDNVSLVSNQIYTVRLDAAAFSFDHLALGGASATATADPYFQIDPAFLAANPGYSLEFSPGIDNVPISATPLPPALPLFASGVIALAGFAWRRKVRGEVST
jgi:hypothetical protein